jgi:hypothetical protein
VRLRAHFRRCPTDSHSEDPLVEPFREGSFMLMPRDGFSTQISQHWHGEWENECGDGIVYDRYDPA